MEATVMPEPRYSRFVQKLRGMDCVVRWNQHPRIKDENVAQHSFHVAVFVLILGKMSGLDEAQLHYLVTCALLHDTEESITSDLPALIKRRVTDGWSELVSIATAELYEDAEPLKKYALDSELLIIKMADAFAALMYADTEVAMGNTLFVQIRAELIWRIYDKAKKMEQTLGKNAMQLMQNLGFPEAMSVPEINEISHL